jgi:hypothetical protein
MKSTQGLTALALAAFALPAALLASPLDPADPWMPPGGTFATMQQSWGAAPQFTNSESIGMHQARFANGQPGPAPTVPQGIIEVGPSAVVTLAAPDTSGGAGFQTTYPATITATSGEFAQAQLNQNPNSPVMAAIHAALVSIGNSYGPADVVASADITPALRNAPYGSHTMLSVYQLRIQESQSEIDTMQNQAATFAGDTQARFNDAIRDVQARRAQVNQDFVAAQNATPETWNATRQELANDYASYASAVARVQRISHGASS